MSDDQKPDIDIQAEANQCHQWWLDQGTRAGPYHEAWQGWAARARLAAERERELQKQHNGLRVDWVNALYDQVQYETLLREAQHAVCSLHCPSVWPMNESQPHCELCVRITEVLSDDDV